MRRLALATCLAILPFAAAAECLTADSVKSGVVFKRADGRSGRVVAKEGGIFVDYAAGKGMWTDQRQTKLGIYELDSTWFYSDEELIGTGATSQTWEFRGKPPVPEAGESWKTRISDYTVTSNSSEQGYQDWSGKFDAVYSFLPEMEAKLSGCTYRAIPVEATFLGENGGFTRRWLYFADLGFGLETKRDGTGIGLTALQAE
jgi:hypothetical protein